MYFSDVTQQGEAKRSRLTPPVYEILSKYFFWHSYRQQGKEGKGLGGG